MLSEANGTVIERDFFKDRLSAAELQVLLGAAPPSTLFNFKSATFKKSGIISDELTEERMLSMLVEEPRYWKRPVAIIDGTLVIGANAKRLESLLQ